MNKCFFVFLRHICLGICIIAFIVACQSTEKQRKLRIIHAGSVSVPLAEIVDSFISLHSDVVIETEAWGSKAGRGVLPICNNRAMCLFLPTIR